MFQRKWEKRGAIIGSKRQPSCSGTVPYRIRIPTALGSFEGILFLYKFRLWPPTLKMPCFHPSCCSLFILSPTGNKVCPVICFFYRTESKIFKPCNVLVFLITAGWQYRPGRLMTFNEEIFHTHSNTFTSHFSTFPKWHKETQTDFLENKFIQKWMKQELKPAGTRQPSY